MNPTYTNPNANFFPSSPSTTLDATKLGQTPQMQLPVAPQDTTNYAGMIASIPTYQEIQSQITQTNPAEQTADDLIQRILGTSQKLGGKTEAQLQAENTSGLPQFQTQLRDITSQLGGLQKEALAIPLQIQQESQGRGVTAGGVAPIQTGRLRENAIKSLSLSAIAETLQGNIANAQATADRAVQLEFAPLENELKTLQTAYEMNKDILARQDRKQAKALEFQLQERQRILDEQKEDKKTIFAWASEASRLGNAPTTVVNQALSTNDPNQALAILSPYLVDKLAKEQQIEAINTSKANRARIYADIALTDAQRAKVLSETVKDTVTSKQQLQNNEALSIATQLLKSDAVGKKSALGASAAKLVPFGQSLGLQPNRTAFEAKVNTLKANLTLDNLKLLKGAMSDKDLLFLNSIGSSLDTNMSEVEFDKELTRVVDKLEKAGATYEGELVTAPDGTQIIITD
jgi:uncharacterized glyoxalase superfamily protein PhnB